MRTGRGAFAAHRQPVQRGPPPHVCHDTTHVIVRGGCDRDGFDPRVYAGRHAGREYRGKVRRKFIADGLARIEERAAPSHAFGMDRTRNFIARGQFSVLMIAMHERLSLAIEQDSPFAAQGFGCERCGVEAHIHGGRVKLDKFRIGNQRAG